MQAPSPQRSRRNKNISCAQWNRMVIFPNSRAWREIRFCAAGRRKWQESDEVETGAGLLLPERQHVQAEAAADDGEQQHRLEGQGDGSSSRRAMAAPARHQGQAER